MIDDKKIEEVAKQHAAGAFISEYWQAWYKEGFVDCAKWMQEEFTSTRHLPICLARNGLSLTGSSLAGCHKSFRNSLIAQRAPFLKPSAINGVSCEAGYLLLQ